MVGSVFPLNNLGGGLDEMRMIEENEAYSVQLLNIFNAYSQYKLCCDVIRRR